MNFSAKHAECGGEFVIPSGHSALIKRSTLVQFMRISVLIMSILPAAIEVFSASPTRGQTIDKTHINVVLKNKSLKTALKKRGFLSHMEGKKGVIFFPIWEQWQKRWSGRAA